MALILFSIALAPLANAQTDEERAGARAAATQGLNAYTERRWADAIDMFSRAETLVHSPVHLLYMARAHAQLGKLVRARELYIKIAAEHVSPDSPQVVKDAKGDADAELAQLEPRIPYVSVVVQGAGPRQVSVTMDGIQVPQALLGVPRPVDPGAHKFQAFAEGMESAASTIELAEGRNETVVLTLQQLAPGAAPAPGPVGPVQPLQSDPQGPAAPEQDSGGGGANGLRIGAYVAIGVGVVGLGLGTLFALQAKAKVDDAESICGGSDSRCVIDNPDQASEVRSLDDDARSQNTLSLVSFVVGGVAAATGVTLFIVSSAQDSNDNAAFSVAPYVGPGSAGVTGRF